MLRGEGVQFQVRKNPDLKCVVVEVAHRTIRYRLYKYFTYKYTYCYIDVFPKFDRAYNVKFRSSTSIAPTRVTDSDVLAIQKRMEAQIRRVSIAKATFRVGQHVRIIMEKMRFAKAAEQNFSTEIFRVAKVIDTRPRVVYELDDLNSTPIDAQVYREELTAVNIKDRPLIK